MRNIVDFDIFQTLWFFFKYDGLAVILIFLNIPLFNAKSSNGEEKVILCV